MLGSLYLRRSLVTRTLAKTRVSEVYPCIRVVVGSRRTLRESSLESDRCALTLDYFPTTSLVIQKVLNKCIVIVCV